MSEVESCFNCVYSHWDPLQMVWNLARCIPTRPVCANHPDFLGQMRRTPCGGVCRNYRPRNGKPEGDIKQIPLDDGFYAYVDAADYEWLSRWAWHLHGGYAVRHEKGKRIYIHRAIMKPHQGMVVDHKNRNKLDNTRENLLVCTQQENYHNRSKQNGALSRFRQSENSAESAGIRLPAAAANAVCRWFFHNPGRALGKLRGLLLPLPPGQPRLLPHTPRAGSSLAFRVVRNGRPTSLPEGAL
jgi:hypothetical protein